MRHRLTIATLVYLLAHGAAARAMQDAAAATPLRISLKMAAQIALAPDGSARVRLAEEYVRQARSQSAQARAALLPHIDASVGQQNQTRNLEAFGIGLVAPVPGIQFPTFVGPFNTFDARATARQSVFDFSAIRRYQAARAGVGSAEAEQARARDRVLADVARAYLDALRAETSMKTAAANVEMAQALLDLAGSQKEVGTGIGIEVTRARVQLANEKQRLIAAQFEHRRAHLLLLRTMSLALGTPIELTDAMEFVPVPSSTPEQALALALESRADWTAQLERLESARLSHSSVKAERIPSVGVFGDYGAIGLGISDSLPTRTYGITVRVPVFDGGARDARRHQSLSQLHQEQIRTEDMRAQIELEVRTALEALRSTEEQVKTAEEGLALAENELAQAQRRYKAGVSIGLEVTDAQTRVQRARENRISALFAHNLARIQMAEATGAMRQIVQ